MIALMEQMARPIRLINPVRQDPLTGKPSLRGYLVVTMGLDLIAKQVASSKIGENGHTLIINDAGKILFHQDPGRLGQQLSPSLLAKVLETEESKQLAPASYQNEASLVAARRYQPMVHAKTGTVAGLEALLRWNDPREGIIAPDRFIPVAEDSGLILPIGEWVLREAGRQLRAWQAAGLCNNACVSVNVSAKRVWLFRWMISVPDIPP